MTEFLVTPTNVDLIESIFRNPITGRWTIPVLTFNTKYLNPYFGEIDPLNDDPSYQKSLIDHFYLRLTEKWLYKEPIYLGLLKYFDVNINGNEGTVSLISDPDRPIDLAVNEKYSRHILKYIEKHFITRRFIEKVLIQYIKNTRIKWYDLFHNIDTLKNLFAHKLKKLIISTIYEAHMEKDK